MKTQEIITQLDRKFEDHALRHEDHKLRVAKCIEWVDQNSTPSPPAISWHGRSVTVFGADCMIIDYDFTGLLFIFLTPFFLLSIRYNQRSYRLFLRKTLEVKYEEVFLAP